jgi:transposase
MEKATTERIAVMLPLLNERQRRLFLASEARAIGHGGISQVSKLSGVSRVTITQGIKELSQGTEGWQDTSRSRRKGGGRKTIEEKHPGAQAEIEALVEPYIKGDPEPLLKWTSKSPRNIERALGNKISDTSIATMLRGMGYRLQSNRKERALTPSHPDRNGQFEYINAQAKGFMKAGLPVISIDAKKKENIGNFKNNGREYAPSGSAPKVLDHDFPFKELGKATPYGIYDIFKNAGFVNVGISGDTAEFAAMSIEKWWNRVGIKAYPDADTILITADCGGSNGYRNRLWKVKLQELANKFAVKITVLHFPPGTSKWNKIEHRLFSFISKNWRGKPLISLAVIINLIGATMTSEGLTVECVADENEYPKGTQVTYDEFNAVRIVHHKFHGEWNYTILPMKS